MKGREIPVNEMLEGEVFAISNEESFLSIALSVYHFQYYNNDLYRRFSDALGKNPSNVDRLESLPFLPVSFFKSGQVQCGSFEPELVFTSSGTTGSVPGMHKLKSAALYERSFMEGFRRFFGAPAGYCILGLLPSYLERSGSSLVYMVDRLVKESGHPESGFYLYEHDQLEKILLELESRQQPAILFGVSYALLDFVEGRKLQLNYTRVVETGGMKGRKKEISKAELFTVLKEGFGVAHIYSEYGMTELLSQAYATDGIYQCPPWMKVLLRDATDPLDIRQYGPAAGGVNIIDLANLYSCSFLATGDAGRLGADGGFEISGRLDQAEIRGCSLMVAEMPG